MDSVFCTHPHAAVRRHKYVVNKVYITCPHPVHVCEGFIPKMKLQYAVVN